ncbi:hypothetical protein ACFLRW_08075, partial [Acidobacteriota bacterium]
MNRGKRKLIFLCGPVFLMIILGYMGCRFSSEMNLKNKIQRAENSLPHSNAIFTLKKRSMSEQMKHYGIPGVSIAVIEDFKLLFAKAYGSANIE